MDEKPQIIIRSEDLIPSTSFNIVGAVIYDASKGGPAITISDDTVSVDVSDPAVLMRLRVDPETGALVPEED